MKDFSQFSGYDMVITMYETLETETCVAKKENKVSPLQSVKWERIFLDKARHIKNKRSNTAKAVFALQSSFKWASDALTDLTGDVYSVIHFLQVAPYFPKCPDKAQQHKILSKIVRHIDVDTTSALVGPTRTITRTDCLEVKEEAFYRSLLEEINTYVQGGNVMDYHALCDLFGRLLKAIKHRYLVVFSRPSFLIYKGNQQTCCICLGPIKDLTVLPALEEPSCPSCSRSATTSEAKGFRSSSIVNKIHLDSFQTSTKIEALREEIRIMTERQGSSKALVFSQLASFLHLVMYSLQESGVDCVILESCMSDTERETSIRRFNEDPDCRILLFGLKSGGGQSFTIASHVFLLDP